ncbi:MULTISPECIES: hydrogenase maturation protease [Microbulbifer]|uniref:hydrogenase maturation protease n=1 Tax=Microbulbifer TaxID=48073 RepID=UPI000746A9F3|nr:MULTISPECIES: hydrogenase maturation protease [Microbulbifer]KUJ84754.1 hypothetical protein AVO43_03655 [Microbulbifer sp. ZGT114]
MTASAIISLGSRYRGDDAVGPHILDSLRAQRLSLPCCIENGGDMPQLLEDWKDRRVTLLDAVMSAEHPPGTVLRLNGLTEEVPPSLCKTSSHGLNLGEALGLARILDRLPRQLSVYAVCGCKFDIGAPLSETVRAAADRITQELLTQLAMEEGGSSCMSNR